MTDGAQGTAKRPMIAVVDDDPAVCGSLKFALELEGFVVRTYHGGAELLGADGLKDCNCFVIDQRMPGMTGMELVEVLRERLVLTPVILLISHPNAALSARAKKAAFRLSKSRSWAMRWWTVFARPAGVDRGGLVF